MPDPLDPTPATVAKRGGKFVIVDKGGAPLAKQAEFGSAESAQSVADRVNETWKSAKAQRRAKGAPEVTREAALTEVLERVAEAAIWNAVRHPRLRTGEFRRTEGLLRGLHYASQSGAALDDRRRGGSAMRGLLGDEIEKAMKKGLVGTHFDTGSESFNYHLTGAGRKMIGVGGFGTDVRQAAYLAPRIEKHTVDPSDPLDPGKLAHGDFSGMHDFTLRSAHEEFARTPAGQRLAAKALAEMRRRGMKT